MHDCMLSGWCIYRMPLQLQHSSIIQEPVLWLAWEPPVARLMLRTALLSLSATQSCLPSADRLMPEGCAQEVEGPLRPAQGDQDSTQEPVMMSDIARSHVTLRGDLAIHAQAAAQSYLMHEIRRRCAHERGSHHWRCARSHRR